MTRYASFLALLCSGAALAAASPPSPPGRPKVVVHHRLYGTSSVVAANRAGTLLPTPAAFINASAIMPFTDGAIYQVDTAPGRVTDIALQPGEQLGSVASGDTARWVIGDTTSGSGATKRAHVLIKPFSAGLSTNLVVTTDRRTYHLSLTSHAGGAVSAMSWTYPQDELIAFKRVQDAVEQATPIASGIDIDQLHFNYRLSGDQPGWRPLRAFDDGRQTFIEFPASLAVGEAPPLFLVGPKGEAQLVNYRVRGRFYVVDRIIDVAELRLGTRPQAIVRITRIDETRSPRNAKGDRS